MSAASIKPWTQKPSDAEIRVPFDSGRLVFPPVLAVLIATVIYTMFSIVFPYKILNLIMAGFLLGYLIYDMIHYYVHHGVPADGTYMYNLKRYHNHHHFGRPDVDFGVSSPLWDKAFGTLIDLRKLAMSIKWYTNK